MRKATPIQKSARGEDCTLRLPMCCNYDPATTVLAHVGSGTAKRNDDTKAVYACSACHDAIDFRSAYFLSYDDERQDQLHRERGRYIDEAEIKTHDRLRAKGLM